MLKRTRRTSALTQYGGEHEAVDIAAEAERPPPLDPALVAARLMLQRALADSGATPADVGRDGTVCVIEVPDTAWATLVRSAWKTLARDGETYKDGTVDRYWGDGSWVAWHPVDEPRASARHDEAEEVARAIAGGLHCAGFAADVSWLPDDLVHAADHRFALSNLTGADVGALVAELCGGPAGGDLAEGEACLLTPRLLRLARRLDQGPDEYVRKLKELLERERRTEHVQPRKVNSSPREAPTLDRLFGMDEAVTWGRSLGASLEAYRAGKLPWADVEASALLSGSPGTGKTLFARALAASCRLPLVSASYAVWLGTGGGHQGSMLIAMKKSFAEAKNEPSILFIDEIDSFGDRASASSSYREWNVGVVNALLAELDGVGDRGELVVLAACNNPHIIDPALVRSGRFDRHIHVRLPDPGALEHILHEHLGDCLTRESLKGVALAMSGSTGADCERVVRGAKRRAREAGRPMVIDDLAREVGGGEDRTEDELMLAAVHEAGHAVAACVLSPGKVRAVHISDSSATGGVTSTVFRDVQHTAASARLRLVFILSGRAAEEVLLGVPSSGAGGGPNSDLARATALAVEMVTSMGLDPGAGLVWSGVPKPTTLPGMLAADRDLATTVRIVLDDAYREALALVRDRHGAVLAVAKALVERGALDGAEVAALVEANP